VKFRKHCRSRKREGVRGGVRFPSFLGVAVTLQCFFSYTCGRRGAIKSDSSPFPKGSGWNASPRCPGCAERAQAVLSTKNCMWIPLLPQPPRCARTPLALVLALGRRNAARSGARCEGRNGRESNEGGHQVLGLGDSRETRVSPMLTGHPIRLGVGRHSQRQSKGGG
jgi:hypothetical protein